MNIIYLCLCFVIFIFTGCQPKESALLIDSFEGEIDKNTVDYGTSEGSSLKVEADNTQKVCGEQALRLIYELKPSGYMWAARGHNLDVKSAAQWIMKPEDIRWDKYSAFSIFMYGNNSGSVVAFDVKDSGGELWRFLLEDDFTGWKEIICPFSQFFARGDWQPEKADKNEKLDFPIMSFQFEPRLQGKGEYRFDCVKLLTRIPTN